ncbi:MULTISPECIES: hypothetical protein [unclassified Halomonas]|uniref:hypothetical protein n=1 Tax=unclassified Halomonas TaxID=2609666 RepID=UPI0007D8D21B|nr:MULTISPECIES: hypothetical protein [unclassified Halomonas]MBT2788636.1 hypothetical protein [Halomonas sp. ISL-106]MBT2798227.1 hypothetical protein [Halomonas sp. ISL-104]OAL60776.1 hypothetical protein A6R74_18870 [Halomonas sp. ALS9]
MIMLFANKDLVQITPSEDYWALLISFVGYPGYGKDFILNNSDYCLVDRIGVECNEESLQKMFTKAFEEELAESVAPKERWLNTRVMQYLKSTSGLIFIR